MMVVALTASRPRYCGTVVVGVDRLGGLEEGPQRDRRRLLARGDQLRQRLVDLLVQRIVEMLGFEEARDAVVRLVVDEDGAEQRLLGLEVVGRGAKGQRIGRGGLGRCLGGLAAGDCVHGPALGRVATAGIAFAMPRPPRFPSSPQTRRCASPARTSHRAGGAMHASASDGCIPCSAPDAELSGGHGSRNRAEFLGRCRDDARVTRRPCGALHAVVLSRSRARPCTCSRA